MLTLLAASLATLLLCIVLMLTRRTLLQRRSVVLHAPVSFVWPRIEDFPQVLADHGRARTLGKIFQHDLVKGDPRCSGSVWRTIGTWGGADYWVDVELVRMEAGREIAIRLLRDSLHTHRALLGHIARLTLQPNGSGTSKMTWELEARFRPSRLLWSRHFDRVSLKARLLDICLRSFKVAIDQAEIKSTVDAEVSMLSTDVAGSEHGAIASSPSAGDRGGPQIHPS